MVRGGMVLLLLSVVRAGIGLGERPMGEGVAEADDLDRLVEEVRDARDEAAQRARPLGPGEELDPNLSEEAELDRLPGVGPVMARAIVVERTENGGFRVPDDLLRVPGIGPATLRKMRPHLDFSGGVPPGLSRPLGRAAGETFSPGTRPGLVPSSPATTGGGSSKIRINRATAEELQHLPGIGPVLAERIVRSRARDGPFRTFEELLRVPGIGPATLARLRASVDVGG